MRRRRLGQRGIVLPRLDGGAQAGEVAAQPAGAVRRGCHHPPRPPSSAAERATRSPTAIVLLQMAARIRDALRADGQLRLAAIPPLPPDQRDPRTEPVIVVHMHIERHAEPRRQPRHRWVVAEQVVQFDRLRPVGAEQRRQFLDLLGQAIDQRVIVGARAPSLTATPPAIRAPAASTAGRSTIGRSPAARIAAQRSATRRATPPPWSWLTSTTDPAAAFACAPAACRQRQRRDPPPRRRQRVGREMRRDQRVVARMQPVQHRQVARQQRPPRPPNAAPNDAAPTCPT